MSEVSLLYGDNPLACAWLASSLEKKLSKQQYLKTSIIDSAKAIEQSSEYMNSESTPRLVANDNSDSQFQFASQAQNIVEDDDEKEKEKELIKKETKAEPMTLRISGQLLYGVVKIYSRKTRYLFEEVSLALIQLKSAFTISKSITLPIEKTIVSSLDSITLKDTVTEANVLYGAETFDINKVFGLSSVNSSARNTQVWGYSNSILESNGDDYAFGDISIGRNAHNESEITGNGTTNNNNGDDNDYGMPDFGDVIDDGAFDNDHFNEANESIDALARRAQVPADDLDGADEFELPLDLNLKENDDKTGHTDYSVQVPGISDFQLSAIDNMDLEFTVDDTHANQSMIDQENVLQFENTVEESEESDNQDEGEEVEQEPTIRKRTRKQKKKINYKSTDVVRTQRKKLVLDESNEIPTEQLKKNQREYPGQLRKLTIKNDETVVNSITDKIVNDLQPSFLKNIGSTWKSIKRRKLLSHNNDDGNEEEDDFLPVNEVAPETDENNRFDTAPGLPDAEVHTRPDDNTPADFDEYPDYNYGGLETEANFEPIGQHQDQVEVGEEEAINGQQPVEEHEPINDFDEDYEDIQTRNKATIEVAHELRNVFELETGPVALFDNIVDSCKLSENKKSSATRAFFELLVLGTANTVKLQQDRLFGEITIESKPGIFENFL